MIKVAFIGAGSVVFSKNLTGDILGYPEFRNATLSYMDIDNDRLQVGAALCHKVAKGLDASPKIEATLKLREALAGADFVINMVQIGGFNSTLVDFEIPRKYGLNFTIADTTGPGGLFRALRTYPMLKELTGAMMELCPRAVLLNYSNPMSMNMQTITRTSNIHAVGLCHSVQGTFNMLMQHIGENPDDVTFLCAGINHMAFYQKLEKNGESLYPKLFAIADKFIGEKKEAVRYELMKRLGYFVTESSEHNAEYCPYFIPNGKEYISRYAVPIDEYLRRCDGIVDEFERMKKIAAEDTAMAVNRSHEYGSTIIHSIVTGKPSVVYGNMPNKGAISNIPFDAIAEVPTLVDRAGLQFTTVGALPPQLVAYMNPHITQHELFIRAAMEGRRDHVYQAAMFDPLTAATMPLDKIVEMCDELIAGHGFEKDGGFLPNLDAKKTLVSGSGKSFAPPTAKELRASWDSAQKVSDADVVVDWHVIGPFPGAKKGEVSLDDNTPLDEIAHGKIDLTATVKAGDKSIKWVKATANQKRAFVRLDDVLGLHHFCIAFGYAEIESIHQRETVLRVGSDDGIKIWLNGKLVHTNEVMRGYIAGEDEVPVFLQAGVNKIVIKISQGEGGWGFGVQVPKANF
ncbi:hypothetical protein BH10PLA1_BH10PLA1_10550 [soil metagenome]